MTLGALSVADSNLATQRRLAEFGAAAMARADTWYRQSLDYSQDQCYRPGTGYSPADPIGKDQLSKGDALVAPGKHVRLFEKWLNPEHTRYRAYDFGSTPVKHQDYDWAATGDYTYTPVRYSDTT